MNIIKRMRNKELSIIFEKIADALELKGENPFKINAYRKASRILKELSEDIEIYYKNNTIQTIKGIGEGITKKIKEYLKTGKMHKYDEAMEGIKPDVLAMLNIPQLGPKTLKLLSEKFGVRNFKDLKSILNTETLRDVPGMGEKKIENIKKGIKLYEQLRGKERRYLLGEIYPIVERIKASLKNIGVKDRIEVCGSFRRMKETIGDIDILVESADEKIIQTFIRLPFFERTLAAGRTKASVIEGSTKIQIDLRIVPSQSFGAALQYFTGSKSHNIKIRGIAKSKGLKLNEYGLFKGDKQIAGKDEAKVYNKLGMEWIPPEMREDRGEVELALSNEIPELVEITDIKGDLHIHSTYSDGDLSIEKIAELAREMGYSYIGISDHSVSAKYARGLDIETLKKKNREIDELNKKFNGKPYILKSAEIDILSDGKLDYPDEILKSLDIVIGAVHQGFKKEVTKRIMRAMESPYVDIIAHPTGRLIGSREGYTVDIEKIMDYAAKTNTVLEINAYYERLDLNDINAKTANERGVKLVINTDTHSPSMLEQMIFGVGVARRAGLRKEDIINTYPLTKLLKLLKKNG